MKKQGNPRFCGFKSSLIIFPALFLFIIVFNTLSCSREKTEEYPAGKIEWIVPYPPGGGADTYSRAVARILSRHLPNGTQVVIKNVPGAGTRRGTAYLFRSKPDGYTIGMLNPLGLLASDLVKKSDQYDLMDFTFLATCGRGIAGIYVRGDSGITDIEDLRSIGNARFAVSSRGSSAWLFARLFQELFDVPVHLVTGYQGTQDYVSALFRKDVDAFAIGFESEVIPYCLNGEMKPVLMFLREPWIVMPDSPTLKGTPFENLEDLANYRFVAAPPGLPADIASILEKALLTTLNDPELLEWAEKTLHPLFVRDAKETRDNIGKCMDLLEKFRELLKE